MKSAILKHGRPVSYRNLANPMFRTGPDGTKLPVLAKVDTWQKKSRDLTPPKHPMPAINTDSSLPKRYIEQRSGQQSLEKTMDLTMLREKANKVVASLDLIEQRRGASYESSRHSSENLDSQRAG